MNQYSVLILTDHTGHSAENSLYSFVQAMKGNKLCGRLEVASRGNSENDNFFHEKDSSYIFTSSTGENFNYNESGNLFRKDLRKVSKTEFDLIWLRLPPPLSESFLKYLHHSFCDQFVINDPIGIYQTGSKSFLLNFPQICPPLKVCKSIADIIDFKNKFPIVLKPMRAYGGKGIIRIDGDKVWEESTETTLDKFIDKMSNLDIDHLGVKYLKNVSQGDKRIVVVNGKIMGASLRMPADNSWLCNVSMGGTSHLTTVTEREKLIVKTINPSLSEMGIVMYGVDTLVDDQGKRILSEINTTSIGGLPQISKLLKKPLVEETVQLLWDYYLKNIEKNVARPRK